MVAATSCAEEPTTFPAGVPRAERDSDPLPEIEEPQEDSAAGDTGVEEPPPEGCAQTRDPIGVAGGRREYEVFVQGVRGEANQVHGGTTTTDAGEEAYLLLDNVFAEDVVYQAQVAVLCAEDGALSIAQWRGEYETPTAYYIFYAVLDPPRPVMPPAAQLGTVGSWTYADSTTLREAASGVVFTALATGTIEEIGTVTLELPGLGPVEGYGLRDSYVLDTSESTSGFQQRSEGVVERWYAESIGPVQERHLDLLAGEELMIRALTGASGFDLSPP
jgi:hypothetical protein